MSKSPKKQTPTQVFFCELCKIFKNIIFIEHLRSLHLNTDELTTKTMSVEPVLEFEEKEQDRTHYDRRPKQKKW